MNITATTVTLLQMAHTWEAEGYDQDAAEIRAGVDIIVRLNEVLVKVRSDVSDSEI